MSSTANTALALELDGISKAYNGIPAVQNICFKLKKHHVLGLVGENGAGKSTILGVINGVVSPDAGHMRIYGKAATFGHPDEAARHGVATVFQEQGLVPQLPVYENMFLGRENKFSVGGVLRRRSMIAEAQAVLDELQIDNVDPCAVTGDLSFGQRQLVEIAKAFALARVYPVEPIILLDEPTSALSEKEAGKLFDGIQHWRTKASIIIVSHSMADIFRCCDDIVALKDGRGVAQLDAKDTSPDKLHELIVGRKREEEYYKEFRQRKPGERVVLSIQRIRKDPVVSEISFDVREGEIVGFAGVLGAGKAVVASMVAGLTPRDGGEVMIEGKPIASGSSFQAISQGIGYVPAERNLAGIIGAHTLEWNLTLPGLSRVMGRSGMVISARKSAEVTNHWLKRLKVRAPGGGTIARNLSGGNQQKVVFAKWLARGVKVLVLDEPGRGLDVGAKEEIYELIRDIASEGTAVLLISDNLPELIGLSNRILVMRKGQVTAEFQADAGAKPAESAIVKHMI
ncbi:sugar ABC transporter ATP-binding protein [Pararhizobium sp. YC-54]|uniref:sugar ABC transporter ATP-binding protein n=1 Tax=Pararhizobium sp. YC-54 TaxID=2986920 RepID=UPI0021F74293|nr:sugar ABC transporter ATP-binding protein [Pararhizobium sp. YC-54]MCV9999648.1 sugar ABC transporter ATP-binding protein [Pararhizobium sp. YC-54]